MPHDGHGTPVSTLKLQSGKPSCMCVPMRRGWPSSPAYGSSQTAVKKTAIQGTVMHTRTVRAHQRSGLASSTESSSVSQASRSRASSSVAMSFWKGVDSFESGSVQGQTWAVKCEVITPCCHCTGKRRPNGRRKSAFISKNAFHFWAIVLKYFGDFLTVSARLQDFLTSGSADANGRAALEPKPMR